MINILRLKGFLTAGCVILIVSVFLQGCLGTFIKVLEYRRDYCDKTSTSLVKKLAIAGIRTRLTNYPTNGLCTTIGATRLEAAHKVRIYSGFETLEFQGDGHE